MSQARAAEFVEENLKTIFAYALSRVQDKNDAEDLTSDIVLNILQSADKIRNENAFYGYVWGIAANTYRKFIRKKSRLYFEEIDDNTPDKLDLAEELLKREEVLKLRREIALLSKEYRECTIAYYYDGLSCAEVSKKLGISLEMVKYYLFKTRKILKEGISMEREFGEKSFNPAPFEFVTIFSGRYNPEYRSLFSRKLPGQILVSAYYTPMTVRELAIELGVASVYLEDEIKVLEKYGIISEKPAGKYQTNIVIFTEDFRDEFYKKAESLAVTALADILQSVKGKLEQIRKLNGICGKLTDDRLLWSMLWLIMRLGNGIFESKHCELQKKDTLYDSATGTNYGAAENEIDGEFGCYSFAGYSGIDERYYASYADFAVLPKRNRYGENIDCTKEKIYKTVSGEIDPEFMILTEEEENRLIEILLSESAMMAELYDRLFLCACRIMLVHAPKSIGEQADRIMFQTLFFRTVGFIGGCAVRSGALAVPDFDGAAALYVRENTKTAEASADRGVMYNN